MKMFSWKLAVFNLILVVIGGLVAWKEGRLIKGTTFQGDTLPWLYHSGVWGDIICLTVISGLVGHYVKSWDMSGILVCLGIAILFSATMHIAWALYDSTSSWIMEPSDEETTAVWRFTWGGVYHMFYMTLAVTIILAAYFLAPNGTPDIYQMKLWVSITLSVMIIFTNVQPGLARCDKIDVITVGTTLGAWSGVWTVFWYVTK